MRSQDDNNSSLPDEVGAVFRSSRYVAGTAVSMIFVITLASFADISTGTPRGAYSFLRQFNVVERGNQQGLAYGGGSLWACFDTGDGNGRIVRYSVSGAVQKRSPLLPLGHCAEIDYRREDGTIYAVDYVKGATTARVRIVDMSLTTPAVIKTINVTKYGLGQMVAIDNARDQLLLKGGTAPYRFNFFALSGTKSATTATWLREVTYRPILGTPQGLEVEGKELLFLSSYAIDGSIAYNRIHSFTRQGTYKGHIQVPIARESEGLAVNPRTNKLYLGFHHPQAAYAMRPAYQPEVTPRLPPGALAVQELSQPQPGSASHRGHSAPPTTSTR